MLKVKPAIKFTDADKEMCVAAYLAKGRKIKRFAKSRRGKKKPAAVVETLNGIRERY
jgi:hypothetical protein